jgi:hypothetical protein
MSILTERKLNIMKVNAELRLMNIKTYIENQNKDIDYPPTPQGNSALPNAETPPEPPMGGING